MKPAEEYILKQPLHLQSIMLHLCAVVEQVVPEADLLFKWKLPFYYFKKKPLCYLNPIKKENAIDLCFFKGHELKKHRDLMIIENRKIVTSLRYNDLKTIDSKVLKEVLLEAVSLY
jgi:hypothetical protein